MYIRVNPRDNVAIIVHPDGVPAGRQLPGGITARERIPQSHKVALSGLETGDPVLRYGQAIGYANRAIPAGSWVHEDLIDMPLPPPLDRLLLSTAVPPPLPALNGYTFEGYRNPDGSVGTRSILGIATTVQCVAPTVEYAARRIKAELLPRFPNVDDVVAVTHSYGCGVAINAPGAAIPISTLRHISLHANMAAQPLVVSLGCEKMQPALLFSNDFPVLETGNVIRLQDQRGFGEMVALIMEAAEKRLAVLDRRRRQTCPASDLIVGLQCGGSDAFSGVTCNPAVGAAADLLVRAGATVMFSEVTEVRDAIHLLTPRAETPEIARALIREMQWYDDYLAGGHADRSANTTPGNKRGGLANIVEKALGSVAKAGSTAIRAVASHGEKVTAKGLVFAATPASDFICGTQQLASMNMHVFTTGEGSPYGLALVPVVKVSSRTALAEKWHDLIDIDAGRIATGDATVEEVGMDLFRLMLDVASGRRKTWAEHWGLANALARSTPVPSPDSKNRSAPIDLRQATSHHALPYNMRSVAPTLADQKTTRVRYTVLAMIFIVSTLNYASRATLSIAGPAASRQLGINALQLGYLFSAFGWTYVIAQIPGGWLLDRFGSRNVYALSILAWSVFTFCQGYAGAFHATAALVVFFGLRLFLGLAEAPAFPANSRIVAAWFPTAERGTAAAIFNSSQYFATFLFAPLSGWITHEFGWTWVFFVTGGMGVVMAAIWMKTVYSPTTHPRVSANELDFIERGGALVNMERGHAPINTVAKASSAGPSQWTALTQLLGNKMLLGVYLGQYCITTITYFFATWFPVYLVQERHMSILKAGFAASVPALCGFAGGILGGMFSDRMLKKGHSLSLSRKLPIVAGMLLSMTMIVCNYVTAEWLVVAIMSVAFLGKGIGALGWAVVSDTSPKQIAGLSGGLFNMCGNVAAITTPLIIGYIVQATKSYQGALVFVAANAAVAIFSYIVIVGEIKRVELRTP